MKQLKQFFKEKVNDDQVKQIIILRDFYNDFFSQNKQSQPLLSINNFKIKFKKYLRKKGRRFEVAILKLESSSIQVIVIYPKSIFTDNTIVFSIQTAFALVAMDFNRQKVKREKINATIVSATNEVKKE